MKERVITDKALVVCRWIYLVFTYCLIGSSVLLLIWHHWMFGGFAAMFGLIFLISS